MILSVENINKEFGGLRALTDISFEVRKGEIASLIGPNGAGKTTLFNIITGFLSPDQGKIGFNGSEITDWKPYERTKLGICRTFQKIKLFGGLTVIDNLQIARHCKSGIDFFGSMKKQKSVRQKTADLLAFMNMHHLADEVVKNLSHGHQKKLQVLLALASEPTLLLLDEPLGGLSSEEVNQMTNLILNLRDQGRTIFIIEHDMRTVMKISEHIIVLNFGKKIAEGKPEEIKENRDVVEAYLGQEDLT